MFNLFKRKRLPKIEFPFEYIIVPGEKAIETCLKIRNDKTKNGSPVILGDDVNFLLETYSLSDTPTDEIISRANEFNLDDFIKSKTEDDLEFYEEIVGEWPKDQEPMTNLTVHTDIVSGKPLKEVYIALIPTEKTYEVPAYLRIGDWNECPAPEEHVGIFKYWYEKYGSEIISMTGDVIECTIKNPPRTKEEALSLANEQFVYCSDIVTQGTETINNLGASLLNSQYWYFWWD